MRAKLKPPDITQLLECESQFSFILGDEFSFRHGKPAKLKFVYIFYFVLCFLSFYSSCSWKCRKCPFSVMIWRSSVKARTSSSVDPMSSGNGQNRKKSACNPRSMYLNDSLWTIYFYCISSIAVCSLCRFSPTLCPCLKFFF